MGAAGHRTGALLILLWTIAQRLLTLARRVRAKSPGRPAGRPLGPKFPGSFAAAGPDRVLFFRLVSHQHHRRLVRCPGRGGAVRLTATGPGISRHAHAGGQEPAQRSQPSWIYAGRCENCSAGPCSPGCGLSGPTELSVMETGRHAGRHGQHQRPDRFAGAPG